jgi:hypothetical protein
MKIEAVIVCLNYSDFLSHTLPHNRNFFDKTVIVTDTKDEDTKRVCEFWNVMCIQTDAFYEDDPIIPNKSRGINEGLKHLSLDGWVVQLDADIFLLPQTRQILQNYPLDEKKIYGIDRLMCNSYREWHDFIHNSKPIYEGWIYCHVDRFPVGTRMVQYHGMGYMAIGYFQLWNPKGSGIYDYPIEKSGFDRTDVVHLKRWSKENVGFIPDLVCIHLASEDHTQGQNWLGRQTSKFEPPFKNEPSECQKILYKLYRKLMFKILKFIYFFLGYFVEYSPKDISFFEKLLLIFKAK